MAFLFTWFKKAPVAPPRVASDSVIPLHFMDDTKINRSINLDVSMEFDHVLDVDMLKGALERVLERPGWRRLGARLRLNTHGKLEYHVPAHFTKERPSVIFTRTKHDQPISQHPLGSTIPKPSAIVQLTPSMEPLKALFLPDGSPKKLADWIYSDRPLLTITTVSFEDATLVTLSWSHIFLDAMSQKKLLTAWTAALEGRDVDIPDLDDASLTSLTALGDDPIPTPDDKLTQDSDSDSQDSDDKSPKPEPYLLATRLMSGLQLLRFVLAMIWPLLLHRREETRTVIIPASHFSTLKSRALSSLSTLPSSSLTPHATDPSRPFLSDGDVLTAWWMRKMIHAHPSASTFPPTKPILIMNVFDMRDVLATTTPPLLRKNAAYIGNCNAAIRTFVTYGELVSGPIGHVAARVRADIVAQSTRAQIDAHWRVSRPAVVKSGFPPLFGEGGMAQTVFSNWTKGNVFGTDFGAAVVGGGRKGVTPLFVLTVGSAEGMLSVRGSGVCVGKDGEGNWWLGGVLAPVSWERMERVLRDEEAEG